MAKIDSPEIKKVFNELKALKDSEILGEVRKVLAILMLSDQDLSKINYDYNSQRTICKKLEAALIPAFQKFKENNSIRFKRVSSELEKLKEIIPNDKVAIDLLKTAIDDEDNKISDNSLGLLPDACIQNWICQLRDIMSTSIDNRLTTAKYIMKIDNIKNKLSATDAQYITVPVEILKCYRDILKKENDKFKIFEDIYDQFICIKYGLSIKINEEMLFGLAFTNPKCFPDNSKLKRLVMKRKLLYRKIYNDTDCYKPDYKMSSNDLDKFIYWNLKTIFKFYTKNPPQVTPDTLTKEIIPLTTSTTNHISTMNTILSESFLIDKDISLEYNNLELLQKQLDITDTDLANALGISKSTFSKNKNSNKFFEKLKLIYFYNVCRDFIYGQTTITNYGKLGCYGQKSENPDGTYLLSVVERRLTGQFLIDIFKNYIRHDETNIRWENAKKIPKNQKMLLQYLTILEDNVNNLTEEDYAAMIRLLRLKIN